MSKWKEVMLTDVCELIAGFAFKSSDFGDYPDKALKIGDIKPPYVDYNSMSGIDLSKYSCKNLDKYKVEYDDFVLAMTGATIGKIGRYIESSICYINQRVLKFKPLNTVNRRFIYYALCTEYFQKYINNHIDSDSAQPNISANTLSKYTFQIPDLPTQQRIASILSSLDAKIENNNKINAKLEEIAQNLFKEWFVDFGPFKDGKFVESELGLIPEGWRVGTLGEICEYSRRKISTKSLTCSNYFSTENMLQNKAGATIASSIPDVETVTGCMEYDVLVSNIRPYFKKILRVTGVSGCSADVLCFHPKASKFYSFLFCSIYDDKFFTYVMSGAKGTKMPRGDKNQIMKYPIILPDDSILGKFSYIIEPLFERINTLKEENQRLSTLRDTLLPKLMSGEIEV
jgi:type I restriction enzyme S subunit